MVEFQGEKLTVPIDTDCLSGEWHGPKSLDGETVASEIRRHLETPIAFPALRQAVVPGDRVVLAIDPRVAGMGVALESICEILVETGVEAKDITVLMTGTPASGWESSLPPEVRGEIHDPEDREQLAYLATTQAGRRVYLNRKAVDADFLLSVGELRHDLMMGTQGPWSTLFPGLSDVETLQAFRAGAGQPRSSALVLQESAEVGWLVGNQFQLGVMAGAGGVAAIVAGLAESVRDEGLKQVAQSWNFRVDERADLVIAGIGEPGTPTGLAEVAAALGAATGLVRRGGRIVVLSRAEGQPGPALQRLMGLEDTHEALARLKGAEKDHDYPWALEIARSLAWADLYLLSNLGEDTTESLGLVPLARPEEALRLAKSSPSVILLSRAEQTRTSTGKDDE